MDKATHDHALDSATTNHEGSPKAHTYLCTITWTWCRTIVLYLWDYLSLIARRQSCNPAVMGDGRYTFCLFILPSPSIALLQLLVAWLLCVLPVATKTIHHELLHSSNLKQRRGPGTGLPQNASGRGLP